LLVAIQLAIFSASCAFYKTDGFAQQIERTAIYCDSIFCQLRHIVVGREFVGKAKTDKF